MACLRSEDGYQGTGKVVSLAVCGMERKVNSQPMMEILERLHHPSLKILKFSEAMILNEPIEEWPICQCLIAFFSMGFPLEKALAYAKLRKPLLINDLESQYNLLDRRVIYEKLKQAGVPVPEYVALNRDEDGIASSVWEEQEDAVIIDSNVFHKPFVEKPVSAEDHNIHIYFPSAAGGGTQQLFRKVEDRSSRYSKESTIRKNGSYIYEKFLATDGTDVKVYTVGPDYAHAEARKSPGLDGKVQRDNSGKEKRFPVILNANEKLIARQVCNAFNQTICGFDLLRDGTGKSYVCDVNGFSFVKNSPKYYDDCAQILKEMIFSKLAPELFPIIRPSVEYLAEEVPVPIPSADSELELRCVIAVVRHGDRTPKQKMKTVVTHERFLQLFEKHNVKKKNVIKLKSPGELQEVLDITRDLLEEIQINPSGFGDHTEFERKMKQTKAVLEMYGYFSGINRKVQFKAIKPPDPTHEKALLMILKWGGELTPAGMEQAEELGKAFRCIYPGGAGEYGSLPGSGFLRLHSTYRHDLKVYASDEGRVQMTAASFIKGLLDLEGSTAPILAYMVKRDVNKLLDNAFVAEEAMARVKKRLHEYMRTDTNSAEELRKKLNPTGAASYKASLEAIKNPVLACQQLYEKIEILIEQISELEADIKNDTTLYLSESWKLMQARWAKLEKDFKHNDGKFDISKIPDIYDCIKYDLLHNSHLGLKVAHDLYIQSMHLADLVMPQEYGITREEKFEIAKSISSPLLCKIQLDISNTVANTGTDIMHQLDPKYSSGVVTPRRHVRTRIYFTSESNIHAMVNMLRFGTLANLEDPDWQKARELLDKTPELNYMTQFVFLLFENCQVPLNNQERYKIEIHFSPGAKEREEMMNNGDSVNRRMPDSKKNHFHFKRMLPAVRDDVVTENLSLSNMPSVKVPKRTSKSLEELKIVRSKAAQMNIFEEEEESKTIDQPTIPPLLPNETEFQSISDNITIQELSGIDLASSVKPLQRLCTISLPELENFLDCRKWQYKEHRTSTDSICAHSSTTSS